MKCAKEVLKQTIPCSSAQKIQIQRRKFA